LKGSDYIMRDLAENIALVAAIRPQLSAAAAVVDSGSIDLEDYGYPRKILIIVSVGIVVAGGSVIVDIESGDTAATCTANTDVSIPVIAAVGDEIYEYKPTRRYLNIEGTVAAQNTTYGVTLIMEHCRFGNRGSDD